MSYLQDQTEEIQERILRKLYLMTDLDKKSVQTLKQCTQLTNFIKTNGGSIPATAAPSVFA